MRRPGGWAHGHGARSFLHASASQAGAWGAALRGRHEETLAEVPMGAQPSTKINTQDPNTGIHRNAIDLQPRLGDSAIDSCCLLAREEPTVDRRVPPCEGYGGVAPS